MDGPAWWLCTTSLRSVSRRSPVAHSGSHARRRLVVAWRSVPSAGSGCVSGPTSVRPWSCTALPLRVVAQPVVKRGDRRWPAQLTREGQDFVKSRSGPVSGHVAGAQQGDLAAGRRSRAERKITRSAAGAARDNDPSPVSMKQHAAANRNEPSTSRHYPPAHATLRSQTPPRPAPSRRAAQAGQARSAAATQRPEPPPHPCARSACLPRRRESFHAAGMSLGLALPRAQRGDERRLRRELFLSLVLVG